MPQVEQDAVPRESGLTSRRPGGLGTPPYGHYDPCAGSLLDRRSPIVNRKGKRGPRRVRPGLTKIAAVKRRKARRPASWAGGPFR